MQRQLAASLVIVLLQLTLGLSVAANPTYLEQLATCRLPNSDNGAAEEGFARFSSSKDYSLDTANPNFFVPTSNPEQAFGFPVRYVGFAGFNELSGTSVIVQGPAEEVKKSVESLVPKSFECRGAACVTRLSEREAVFVGPHPTNKDLTLIMCAATHE